MKKIKLTGLLVSAFLNLSIIDRDVKPINLKNIDQIFDRFNKTPITLANYPKIAHEKGFYRDYISEELRGSSYFNSEVEAIPFKVVMDSLVNKTMALNKSYNNHPRKSEKVYLKDINNDGNVGVGKQSGYYFSLF